jgi:hypothetical protein
MRGAHVGARRRRGGHARGVQRGAQLHAARVRGGVHGGGALVVDARAACVRRSQQRHRRHLPRHRGGAPGGPPVVGRVVQRGPARGVARVGRRAPAQQRLRDARVALLRSHVQAAYAQAGGVRHARAGAQQQARALHGAPLACARGRRRRCCVSARPGLWRPARARAPSPAKYKMGKLSCVAHHCEPRYASGPSTRAASARRTRQRGEAPAASAAATPGASRRHTASSSAAVAAVSCSSSMAASAHAASAAAGPRAVGRGQGRARGRRRAGRATLSATCAALTRRGAAVSRAPPHARAAGEPQSAPAGGGAPAAVELRSPQAHAC